MCRLTTQSSSWQNNHCRDRLIVYLDTALIVFSSQYKPHAFGLFKNGPTVHKSWIRNNHKRTRCGTRIWRKILTPTWKLVQVQLESRPTCGPSLRPTINSNKVIQVLIIFLVRSWWLFIIKSCWQTCDSYDCYRTLRFFNEEAICLSLN